MSLLSKATIALLVALPCAFSAASGQDPVSTTRVALRTAMADALKQPRATLVARETYLLSQKVIDVRLSPDGRFLSFVRRTEQGLDVVLKDVSSGVESRVVAGLSRVETNWSGDGRRLWLADEQGLAVVESAGLGAKRVFKWDARRSQRLSAVDARAPHYAIISERIVQAGDARYRYLRVDAEGKANLLHEAALPLRDALLMENGDLAYTSGFEGARYETVIRQHTVGEARELLRCTSLDECRLTGYNEAQRALWMLAQHDKDKLALRQWQQKSGRLETIHSDPVASADVDMRIWSAASENWLALSYHDGRRKWYGNDNGTRAILAALERRLPHANLRLQVSTDRLVWLVHAQQANRALDRYYLYRPDQKQLKPLFTPEVAATRMPPEGAEMHPVRYRASDGMLLNGYVLLPAGIAPGKAPLIAWIHGGPITRVYDQYNGGMQLLVNRGYAVFVPNFRGSTGYGLKYMLAANGDVGNGRVLSDIIDGMDFLLAEGIGDRNRQAVMGMSFGGYASLLALSHHPERFRFAFAGAPPTEYGWIKQWQADNDRDALRAAGPPLSLQFTQLGFRYRDADWREKMRRESPLAALRALKSPVYIWAGARDDRVPLKSIVNYVGEARRIGKPISLLIDPDAGHSPSSALGTEASLYLIELAAHRHFGGALTPVSPELQTFLSRNLRIE